MALLFGEQKELKCGSILFSGNVCSQYCFDELPGVQLLHFRAKALESFTSRDLLRQEYEMLPSECTVRVSSICCSRTTRCLLSLVAC